MNVSDPVVVAKVDAAKVGVDVRALVLVVFMETQQVLIKLERLDGAALGVGGLDFPRHEFRGGIKHRTVGA